MQSCFLFKFCIVEKISIFGAFWRVASLLLYTLYLITLCYVDVALYSCFNF